MYLEQRSLSENDRVATKRNSSKNPAIYFKALMDREFFFLVPLVANYFTIHAIVLDN